MHVLLLVELEYACSVSAARLFWVDPLFQRGDLFLLAITCVWRLHWSVRPFFSGNFFSLDIASVVDCE